MISSALLISYFLVFLIKTYDLPKSLGWISVPLLLILIPIILLIYNFISYVIIPLRNYFDKIHKINGLPSFSKANKDLLKGILYFTPSLGVVILVIILSIIGIPENIIGPITVISTLIAGIIGLFLPIKNIK